MHDFETWLRKWLDKRKAEIDDAPRHFGVIVRSETRAIHDEARYTAQERFYIGLDDTWPDYERLRDEW